MSIPRALKGTKYLERAYYLIRQPSEVLPPYTGVQEALNRFTFMTGTWRKLGLLHDDILFEYPYVTEAIRRLPLEVQDQRNFRLVRAIQCDIKHIWLAEEQWTTYEQDCTKGRYLQPYVADVLRELAERDAWEAEH